MQQTCKKQIIRWNRSKPTRVEDELVVEEPLEIRVETTEFNRCHANTRT